jgi:hypothetical protein
MVSDYQKFIETNWNTGGLEGAGHRHTLGSTLGSQLELNGVANECLQLSEPTKFKTHHSHKDTCFSPIGGYVGSVWMRWLS